jgi:histidinol-phosphate phosphatase family protein
VQDAGWRLMLGERRVTHPVRPAGRWVSVRAQAGNADDALMRRLHGAGWRRRVGAPSGRLPRHVAITAAAVAALAGAVSGGRKLAAIGAAGWLAGMAEFAAARLRPGPRTPAETVTMLLTSAPIPPVATIARLGGELRHRRAARWPGPPVAVLFDRDGTLIRDIPYNSDPAAVEPMPGAVAALTWLRGQGIPVGVVSNQSGVARGLLSTEDVARVDARVDELLGPFDTWQMCPHRDEDGCGCRKPAPGMVLAAAAELGLPADRCVLVGDVGADVQAAWAAGARPVLAPTAETRPEEVRDAAVAGCPVAGDLMAAVALALGVPANPLAAGRQPDAAAGPAGGTGSAAGPGTSPAAGPAVPGTSPADPGGAASRRTAR